MLIQQAVLFRASHRCGPLEVELSRRNIPFVKFGGLKFLDAAHIKDMLALLRNDTKSALRFRSRGCGSGPSHANASTNRPVIKLSIYMMNNILVSLPKGLGYWSTVLHYLV
jgi:UvrD-like helicase C-terminal domain